MRQYQEKYCENTRKVGRLLGSRATMENRSEDIYWQKLADHVEIVRLREENMGILREQLIPLMDNILNAPPEDIEALEEFADVLMKEQLDNGMQYQVCSALAAFARRKKDRDLLIKELYMAAMAAYSFQRMEGKDTADRFRWKMSLLFGEAAGYFRHYDEIENAETRGYIHRAMGNLALGYTGNEPGIVRKKMDVIRHSLQVLNDSVYHEKTPNLPWDLYIYKSHQERTTLLSFLRSGEATIQDIKEVMESAQVVYDRQVRNAREKGVPLQPQWEYAYYAASYHGGIHTLEEFLQNMEKVYAAISATDHSQQGMYGNVFIPALYSVYVKKDEGMAEKKKPVVLMMYRRMVQYVKQVPHSMFNDALFYYIRGSLEAYIEYPGEYSFRDFIEEMVACRQPETYVHSQMVARISQAILHRVLEQDPKLLLGVRGYDSEEALLAHREELDSFLYECGMLHDIGKMKLLDLYDIQNRSWTEEEEKMHRLHTVLGYEILQRWPSTRDYAIAALGHHTSYGGQGGYPEEYHREDTADAALIDILCVADYIDRNSDIIGNYQGTVCSPAEALEKMKGESGIRLAPCFVDAALDIGQELCRILEQDREEAYREAYLLQY
ncbi:MAG: HD domain-containing protein [Lachnospiraceae bacterium]|nr:HD domain-containing protein [Lachnospiraceae bacterium]MCM1240192.1 HD domain-containing protein [Lachnospiraceae bacterium]